MMKKIISVCLCLLMTLNLFVSVFGEESELKEESEVNVEEVLLQETPRKRTSTFDYPLWGDPNYISDEEFFGKWNAAEKKWILKPYWDYSKYPELAAVEAAAKAGDYEAAEKALLEYYRPKKYERIEPVTSINKTSIVRSQLLEKNFYAVGAMNGLPIDIFTVNNNWQEISIDVTESIRKAIGSESFRTFLINAIDKEKSYAEFYSKESGNGPVLSMVVNGVAMELPALRDTYISAGFNSHRNYGSEKTMIVQESGTFQNHDADTKRAYIAFDLRGLKATDEINAATLNIKGRNASGTGEKEMLLYQWNDSNWEEHEVCWDYFSEHLTFSCNDQDCWDYVTSNKTDIKGKICFFHRGNELLVPAQVFDYTHEERYGYTFLRQIMGLVNSIGVNPNVMNQLDMATHLDNTSKSVWLTIDSQYMSPEILTALIKHFWLMADWLVENYYGKATNNWGSFATLGVYSIIARFKELEKCDYWMEKTKQENDRLNSHFALNDGTCIELAMGYTNTLLTTLYNPVTISVLTNTPLPYSDFVMEQIRKMLLALSYGTSPGFRGFHWGDSMDYNEKTVYQIKRWYENVFKDVKELEFFATDGQSGKAPDFTSISFPDGLRTIMRSDWSEKALSLQITGKSVGSHGHRDVTSISMFAYGKFLLTDQGHGHILTGDTYNYMISSQQHNLVTMNYKNQNKGQDGICKAVEINNLYDFVTYTTPMTEDAKAHERSVLFARDSKFWIVSDYLSPKDENAVHTYQQYWHMLPTANLSIDKDTKVARSNFDDVNVMVVPIAPEEFSHVAIEDSLFAPTTGSLINSKKAAYHKTAKGDVTYDTILIPVNVGDDFSVASSKVDCGLPQGAANSFVFQLYDNVKGTYKKYYYYHLNDKEQKRKITIGKYSTDATTMFIEENQQGSIESVFLINASILEDSTLKHKVLFKSTESVPAVSFRPNGANYEVVSSALNEHDISKITLYNYNKIKNVIFNGAMVKANSKGGYMYFGTSPILDVEDDNNGSQPDEGNTGSGAGGGTHAGASREGAVNPVVVGPSNPQSGNSATDNIPDYILQELEGHWGKEDILDLYKEKIIVGDPTLRLQDSINRAEFITLIVKMLGLEPVSDVGEFEDVKLDDWFSTYVSTAKASGLVNGADGKFRPNDTITREEMCKILMTVYDKFANNEDEEEQVQEKRQIFSDDSFISEWARDYVYRSVELGLMKGMDNNIFAPKESALREQAFVVIRRLQKILK